MKKELFTIALTFASLNISANLDDDVDASDAEVAGINASYEEARDASVIPSRKPFKRADEIAELESLIAENRFSPLSNVLAYLKKDELGVLPYVPRHFLLPERSFNWNTKSPVLVKSKKSTASVESRGGFANDVDLDVSPIDLPMTREQIYAEEHPDENSENYEINRHPLIDEELSQKLPDVFRRVHNPALKSKIYDRMQRVSARRKARFEKLDHGKNLTDRFTTLAKHMRSAVKAREAAGQAIVEQRDNSSLSKAVLAKIKESAKSPVRFRNSDTNSQANGLYKRSTNPLLSEGYFNL